MRVGVWRIEREIGRGGMAAVYAASHTRFGKRAAIKLAHEAVLGPSFTLADLNVASVLSMGLAAKFDFSAYPNVQQWLGRCVGRPAARPPKKS